MNNKFAFLRSSWKIHNHKEKSRITKYVKFWNVLDSSTFSLSPKGLCEENPHFPKEQKCEANAKANINIILRSVALAYETFIGEAFPAGAFVRMVGLMVVVLVPVPLDFPGAWIKSTKPVQADVVVKAPLQHLNRH